MKVMARVFWSWWLLALASCGDAHPAAVGGKCDDGAKCDCTDGRPGQAVCDVDTHAFVMCDCPTPTQHAVDDADASTERADSAAGSGGERAHAGQMAAADGGRMAAAGQRAEAAGQGAGGQDEDGAAGDGPAGHPGKALGNGKAHGSKH